MCLPGPSHTTEAGIIQMSQCKFSLRLLRRLLPAQCCASSALDVPSNHDTAPPHASCTSTLLQLYGLVVFDVNVLDVEKENYIVHLSLQHAKTTAMTSCRHPKGTGRKVTLIPDPIHQSSLTAAQHRFDTRQHVHYLQNLHNAMHTYSHIHIFAQIQIQ